MSAIGDYVHLTAAGYYHHGTKRYNENSSNYYQVPKIFESQRNKIKKQMYTKKQKQLLSDKEQQELSMALELLMRPGRDNAQKEQLDKIWEKLVQQLDKRFNNNLGQIKRNCANIFSDSVLANHSDILKTIEIKSKNGQQKKSIYLQTILKRIKIIEKLMADSQNSFQVKKLKKQINQIYKNLSIVSNLSQESLRSTQYKLDENNKITIISPDINISNLLLTEQQYDGVVTALNKIIARANGSSNLQKGTLFEYMIAAAPIVCKKTTVDNVQEILKSVVGDESTSVKIDTSKFFKGVKLENILKGYSYSVNDNLYVANSASQDKVDVKMQWNGKEIPISAKNVNIQSGRYIHLVSGASLLAMTANLNQDYMNHFLNIVAQHNFSKDTMTIQPILLNEAHTSLKEILMLQALQGYKTGSQKADFFVVNDNTTGRVKIFSIAQLVLDAIGKINSFIEVIANNNPIETIRFSNDFQEKYYSFRITKLMNSVHAQKITVGLNPNMLYK